MWCRYRTDRNVNGKSKTHIVYGIIKSELSCVYQPNTTMLHWPDSINSSQIIIPHRTALCVAPELLCSFMYCTMPVVFSIICNSSCLYVPNRPSEIRIGIIISCQHTLISAGFRYICAMFHYPVENYPIRMPHVSSHDWINRELVKVYHVAKCLSLSPAIWMRLTVRSRHSSIYRTEAKMCLTFRPLHFRGATVLAGDADDYRMS